ncbi:MAG TPA: 50S ribosomal protein L3 [Polyangiales bacterium]|nr:50S ribosomal protein L3 [Polyangiales bacterium]
MNTNVGLIGKKLGNTQVFNDDGSVARVTAILVGPCRVMGKRTLDKDGYSALILGFGEKREKLLTKAEVGHFKKIGQAPARTVREFRLAPETVAKFEVGQALKPSEYFKEGQKVDVSGTTRGRGFSGVMRRWNFRGSAKDTHGTHEYKRHGGSIGTNMTPGRTFLNLKMPGQYGNERQTVLNLVVAKVMDDENLILVKGGVPGSKNGIVTVRGAVKAKTPKA